RPTRLELLQGDVGMIVEPRERATRVDEAELRSGSSVTLSVVIPALNEEDGIADIIQRVRSVEPALKGVGVDGLEIVVVDDGSRDRTADIAASFPGVHLERHPINRGYGAAIKTGFSQAQGELV